jgi:hypothetical protein
VASARDHARRKGEGRGPARDATMVRWSASGHLRAPHHDAVVGDAGSHTVVCPVGLEAEEVDTGRAVHPLREASHHRLGLAGPSRPQVGRSACLGANPKPALRSSGPSRRPERPTRLSRATAARRITSRAEARSHSLGGKLAWLQSIVSSKRAG